LALLPPFFLHTVAAGVGDDPAQRDRLSPVSCSQCSATLALPTSTGSWRVWLRTNKHLVKDLKKPTSHHFGPRTMSPEKR
jgi:hypothetical protein